MDHLDQYDEPIIEVTDALSELRGIFRFIRDHSRARSGLRLEALCRTSKVARFLIDLQYRVQPGNACIELQLPINESDPRYSFYYDGVPLPEWADGLDK